MRRTPQSDADWLYVKLYAGSTRANHLLMTIVEPVVRQAISSGVVDSWFFVRYGDPESHIRLRLHGEPRLLTTAAGDLLERCSTPVNTDLVWRVQFQKYQREIDRYGGPTGMHLAERLFYADSEFVLDVVRSSIDERPAQDTSWRVALSSVDRLLDNLGLDLSGKHALVTAAKAQLGSALHSNAALRRQLADRYRRERLVVEEILGRLRTSEVCPAIESALARRSRALRPIVEEWRHAATAGEIAVPAQNLALSFAHMHLNRMLSSAVREQEFVLLDFLSRFYRSEAVRRSVSDLD